MTVLQPAVPAAPALNIAQLQQTQQATSHVQPPSANLPQHLQLLLHSDTPTLKLTSVVAAVLLQSIRCEYVGLIYRDLLVSGNGIWASSKEHETCFCVLCQLPQLPMHCVCRNRSLRLLPRCCLAMATHCSHTACSASVSPMYVAAV